MTPRRHFLCGSAALAGSALFPLGAAAQTANGIRLLRGEVRVNGRPIDRSARIRTGDEVATGAGGFVLFVVGRDAFMLRERTSLRIEPAPEPFLVTSLRLISGALGAVFARRSGAAAKIVTPTVTAGIRGTGCYCEAQPAQSYFCTCYGTIDLVSAHNPRERISVTARHHDAPQLFLPRPRDGQLIVPAGMQTHTDAEMEALASAAGQTTPW